MANTDGRGSVQQSQITGNQGPVVSNQGPGAQQTVDKPQGTSWKLVIIAVATGLAALAGLGTAIVRAWK